MTQAVVADVRDRNDVDRVITAGKRFEPGSIKVVTFKDEGEDDGMIFGPVTLWAHGTRAPAAVQMVPFGTPDPDGVFYLGWLTKRQAGAIARNLGAALVEV